MILFWLAAGIIAVTVAYFLSPQTTDPWRALNVAGVVAGAYLLALLLSTLRKPLNRTVVVSAWAMAFIAGTATIVVWTGYEEQSRYQTRLLSDIRGRISRGVIAHELSQHLLPVFESYHKQPMRKQRPLSVVFQEKTGAAVGSDLHKPTYESDRLRIIVASVSEEEVVLVAQEGYVKGRDPDFRNLDGGTGLIQELARITPKGILYESQN